MFGSSKCNCFMPNRLAGFVGRHLAIAGGSAHVDNRGGGFGIYEVRDRPAAGDPAFLPYLPGIGSLWYEVTRHGLRGDADGWIAAGWSLRSRAPKVDQVQDGLALGYRMKGAWRTAWALYRPGLAHGTVTGANLLDAAVCAVQAGEPGEARRLLARCRLISPWTAGQVDAALADLDRLAGPH